MHYKGINTSAYSMSDVFVYKPEILIFLDESGSDKCDYLKKYASSLCRKPPVCHTLQP